MRIHELAVWKCLKREKVTGSNCLITAEHDSGIEYMIFCFFFQERFWENSHKVQKKPQHDCEQFAIELKIGKRTQGLWIWE